MNRGPERAFRSIFAVWARLKLEPTPAPAPASLVFHSLPATYASMTLLNAGPPNCTTVYTRVQKSSVHRVSLSQRPNLVHPFSRARLIILVSRLVASGRGRRRSSGENRSLKISRLRKKGRRRGTILLKSSREESRGRITIVGEGRGKTGHRYRPRIVPRYASVR